MTINLNKLHVNSVALAGRILDARSQGKERIEIESLDDIQKRFLQREDISFSFDPETETWSIKL